MTNELDKFLRDRTERKLFEQERLILEVTEEICRLMNSREVTQTALANRLRCNPSFVSQVLDGSNNFTLRTIADFMFELDARLVVTSRPLSESVTTESTEAPPCAPEWRLIEPRDAYRQVPDVCASARPGKARGMAA